MRTNLTPIGQPGKFNSTAVLLNTFPGFAPASDSILFSTAGDLNCDSKQDLVLSYQRSGGSGGAVVVLLNQGDPGGPVTFVPEAAYGIIDNIRNDAVSIAIAELNGQPGPEIAVADWKFNSITVLGNTRCGGMDIGEQTYLVAGLAGAGVPGGTAYTTPIEPWSVTAADFDGDGDIDLGASSAIAGEPRITVLENDGVGNFETDPREQQTFCVGAQEPQPIVSGDLDGNGIKDFGIAFRGAVSAGGGIGMLLNGGDTIDLGPFVEIPVPPLLYGTTYYSGTGLAINDNGVVVGEMTLFTPSTSDYTRYGIFWDPAQFLGDTQPFYPTLPVSLANGLEVAITDINAAGKFIINNYDPTGGIPPLGYTFVAQWNAALGDFIAEPVAAPYSTPNSWGSAINDHDVIAGTLVSEDHGMRAFLNDSRRASPNNLIDVQLGLDDPSYGPATGSLAYDVNEADLVVGEAGYMGFFKRAFLYSHSATSITSGWLAVGDGRILPLHPTKEHALARALNDATTIGNLRIVGTAYDQDSPNGGVDIHGKPVVWEWNASISDFEMKLLPYPTFSPTPQCSIGANATAVNDAGVIVGNFYCVTVPVGGAGMADTPVRWRKVNGTWQVEKLADLLIQVLGPQPGWHLATAEAINNAGQVTGMMYQTGVSNPQVRAYRFNLP